MSRILGRVSPNSELHLYLLDFASRLMQKCAMATKTKTQKALRALDQYCSEHDLRATEPRRAVLSIVIQSAQTLTAYEILEKLKKKMPNPKPPTAYRALDFLNEHGFIHRIESLNAYVLCNVDHKHTGSQFLICDSCGNVNEAHLCHLPASLEKEVQATKFHTSFWNLEIHGLCKNCR